MVAVTVGKGGSRRGEDDLPGEDAGRCLEMQFRRFREMRVLPAPEIDVQLSSHPEELATKDLLNAAGRRLS